MNKYLLLACGSLAGGFARYFMAGAVYRAAGSSFPHGTLAVNLLGCFLIGFFDALAEDKLFLGPDGRMLLMIGFCGAFTTFSTLILETAGLARTGQYWAACANVTISVVLGLALFRAGLLAGRVI
ncbi:MAG: fluoride efflux transporter CrcB [Elusimicrobia bacterium]|nr:fluoride efflux transporter CrcB [Elusimicrobiota bacterium]